MQRIWRKAQALFSYHMCFSVVDIALFSTGNAGYLRYLACGVFLQVSGSENKCPSWHFSSKACINKAFIAVLLLWHQKRLSSGRETQDFFCLSLKFKLLAIQPWGVSLSWPCSVPGWAHLVAVLPCCRAALGLEGNSLALCAAWAWAVCANSMSWVCMWCCRQPRKHGQGLHSCCRST